MAGAGLASIEDILCRIDNLLRLVDEAPGGELQPGLPEAETVEAARRALMAERERARMFGADMFPNPGWAILLHLFVAGIEERDFSSGDLCAAACVAETVALRHLAALIAAKLVRRQPRLGSPGATYLALTPTGEKALCDYFNRVPRERDAAAA